MANYYNIVVDYLQEVTIDQLGDNVRILLNDILFLRDINITTTIDVYSDIYKMSYITGNDTIVNKIEKYIDEFRNHVLTKKKHRVTLVLEFYKIFTKKEWFGLSETINKIYWEKWNIPVLLYI